MRSKVARELRIAKTLLLRAAATATLLSLTLCSALNVPLTVDVGIGANWKEAKG